jgi:hypothetical protein
MSITSLHPAYADYIMRWKRCRDAYDGEDAVKDAGEVYLPKLSGQDGTEYAAYKMRALYYGAVGRSIDGFVGAIARKAPVIKLPAKLQIFEKDTTASGIGLLEFIKKMACEDLLQGRAGVLVDFEDDQRRAYLSTYTAESITNWGPDFIVLRETAYETDGSNSFVQKAIDQYRELRLENNAYIVRIWRKKASAAAPAQEEWFASETVTPAKHGKQLNFIPFFWLSSYGQSNRVEKPPLLGLVNVAMSHYRSSADLEHGRHFTGLPTLYVTGSTSSEPIRVGSQAAILLSDPTAKVGFAEFSGQGLGSLEKALQEKEHMMAVLGGSVFADQRKGVEAAETARIRTSGETSLLMGIVNSIEETLESALKCAGEWMNVKGDIDIDINRDFIDTTLDPMTLTALLKSYLSNAISIDTFLFNLKQAEMIAPDRTIEEEMASLPDDPPADASKAKGKAKAKKN